MASSEKSRKTTELWLEHVKTLKHVPTDDELYDWCVDHKIKYDYWAQTPMYKGIKTRLAELAGHKVQRERRKQKPGKRNNLLKKYGFKSKEPKNVGL